jgi:hypothetical protein
VSLWQRNIAKKPDAPPRFRKGILAKPVDSFNQPGSAITPTPEAISDDPKFHIEFPHRGRNYLLAPRSEADFLGSADGVRPALCFMNHDPDVEKEFLLWSGRHTAHPARDNYLGKDEFDRIYLRREVGRMSRFYREIMDKYSIPR